MVTIISNSPEETWALGRTWGAAARPGLVIGLTGDLGAGKTQLVQGLAEGLGITDRVQSPTFALVNQYGSGRLPLAHIDLYRLDTRAQILGAGLVEFFEPGQGISVVEWAERWFNTPAEFPPLYRRVTMESLDDTSRRIVYEDFGT